MPSHSLAELLTGRALNIPRYRLDMQGWVAAFRRYSEAAPQERMALEIELAEEISHTDDWELVAHAITLARSLNMGSPRMRTATRNAELSAPGPLREVISTEARRYFRDVQERQVNNEDELYQALYNAGTNTAPQVVYSVHFRGVSTGTSDVMGSERRPLLIRPQEAA